MREIKPADLGNAPSAISDEQNTDIHPKSLTKTLSQIETNVFVKPGVMKYKLPFFFSIHRV